MSTKKTVKFLERGLSIGGDSETEKRVDNARQNFGDFVGSLLHESCRDNAREFSCGQNDVVHTHRG